MIGSIIVSVLARKKPSTSGTAAPPEFVNRAAKRKRGRMDDTFFKTFHNPAIHILFRLKFASDSFAPNEEISNRESQQSWKQIRGSK